MLNIPFPTEVFGEVKNTDFEDLEVDFMIEKVTDDQIQLPEICQVPIEDVYPTIYQENNCLNVEVTAEHFDRYRFFYSYIFLAFDADDDRGWASKNLEARVKLFYDLKSKKLSKGMSSYVRQIIAEIKYIQFKREILTSSIEDNETMDDSKETIAKLVDFHLRMNKIKHEMEILVNSEMREAYESIKFGRKSEGSKQIFVIAKSGTLGEQMNILEHLKEKISSDTAITYMKDLSDALSCSTADTEIYIPSGRYSFSFLDYLNNNLLFCGVEKLAIPKMNPDNDTSSYSCLYSTDKTPMLFVIDGDMKFENLVIDCRNVKTGFAVKSGSVMLKNCLIYGLEAKESTVSEAFNISGDSSIVLENCTIRNFATAFNLDGSTKIEINNSRIENCSLGMDVLGENVKVSFNSSCIIDFETYGIMRYSEKLDNSVQQVIDVNDENELKRFNIALTGDNQFAGSHGSTSSIIKIISKLVEDEIVEISDDEEIMEIL